MGIIIEKLELKAIWTFFSVEMLILKKFTNILKKKAFDEDWAESSQ